MTTNDYSKLFSRAFLLLPPSREKRGPGDEVAPTTQLLETVLRLKRFYPHTDRNMVENFSVRLEVALGSVHQRCPSEQNAAS